MYFKKSLIFTLILITMLCSLTCSFAVDNVSDNNVVMSIDNASDNGSVVLSDSGCISNCNLETNQVNESSSNNTNTSSNNTLPYNTLVYSGDFIECNLTPFTSIPYAGDFIECNLTPFISIPVINNNPIIDIIGCNLIPCSCNFTLTDQLNVISSNSSNNNSICNFSGDFIRCNITSCCNLTPFYPCNFALKTDQMNEISSNNTNINSTSNNNTVSNSSNFHIPKWLDIAIKILTWNPIPKSWKWLPW